MKKNSKEDSLTNKMIDLFVNEKWILKDLYQQINQHLTPNFSVEDWLSLHEKAIHGDLLSTKLLLGLWKSKVDPFVKQEFKLNKFQKGEN